MAAGTNGVARLAEVMEYLNAIKNDWRIQQIRVFLEIAMSGDEGILQTELSERLGLAQAPISRNCKALWRHEVSGDDGREARGLDFIRMEKDSLEPKKTRCFITATGRKVAEHIRTLM